MTLDLAYYEDLAARINAAIDAEQATWNGGWAWRFAADRERVASDLAGLRECYLLDGQTPKSKQDGLHARRYADNLTRTARLYGVTP